VAVSGGLGVYKQAGEHPYWANALLIRHSNNDLGTYAQAVTADKREVQDRIAAMILPYPVAEIGTLVA
jgi:hypothetical protein